MTDFREFGSIGFGHRWGIARDLMMARQQNPQLEQELPYVAAGYGQSHLRVWRRLGRIKRAAAAAQLHPEVIMRGGFAVGVATAQINDKAPANLPPHSGTAVELSYWHAAPNSGYGRELGTETVTHLAEVARHNPFNAELLWTVTLPEDQVKTEVFRQAGFLAVRGAQRYDIDDGATVPRQLWAQTVQ